MRSSPRRRRSGFAVGGILTTIPRVHPHREADMRWHLLAGLGLVTVGAVVVFALTRAEQPKPAEEPPAPGATAPAERVLPGLRKDGSVQLPNQWSLKPAGRHLEVGDF